MVNINKRICNYIASNWIKEARSYRTFALDHNIDEKTVRKIVMEDGYNIPVKTLYKICESREIKPSTFFELIGL